MLALPASIVLGAFAFLSWDADAPKCVLECMIYFLYFNQQQRKMKKKMYEKPSLEVVKVQVQNQLLEGSGLKSQNYKGADDPFADPQP